jgi:hypothetical protein
VVWHDFDSPVPWEEVKQAIEAIGFAEGVVHVEGTDVAFLHKGSEREEFPGCEAPALPDQRESRREPRGPG